MTEISFRKEEKYEYVVELPNKDLICLWFLGDYLEMIFKAYNVKYTKRKVKE